MRTLKAVAATLLTSAFTFAFQPPERAPLPNYDKRAGVPAAAAPAGRNAALTALKSRVSAVNVDLDPIVGAPKFIRRTDGFLTGSAGQGVAVSQATAAKVGVAESHRAVKMFVTEHAGLFRHDAAALKDDEIKRSFTAPKTGLRTVVWQQHVDGIPVFEGVFIAHTTRNEELVSVSSQFVPVPEQAANNGKAAAAANRATPIIDAPTAVASAATNVGVEVSSAAKVLVGAAGAHQKQTLRMPGLTGDTEAELVWLPMSRDVMRLCWQVVLTGQARAEIFRVLVDAETGEVLLRHCLTEYLTNATYRVYLSDSPSPFSPAHLTPLTNQPPVITRTLLTLSALDTNASPNGWIDDSVNETRGNNVDAHTDRDANNVADLPRPQGTPFHTFDFPMDLTQQPSAYTNAAVVQLFYTCNWIHDRLYQLGFTEAAGNFQMTNFGRGGLGNDSVQADAQDGSGYNNANFSTPSDGSSGRMQMYLFNYPSPFRDGDLDSEIVIHEYVHGLSNRRVGGGVGMSSTQSRGMGEGWSDWYAITMLSESNDVPSGAWAKGGYATYQLSGLAANYYYGIRRYPYSTDLTKDPLTFKDIDPGRASPHTGIPISPIGGGGSASEVHNQGEVWCSMLWEARANLVAKHGYAVGNELILQLVTDGMNLSPANPTFLQARDAILQASLVHDGGQDLRELWAAFAKRGMGASASGPVASTTSGVLETYDVPDSLSVFPTTGFTAKGPVGGPFLNATATYTLANLSTNSFPWSAGGAPNWLMVSPPSGNVPVGGSNVATVSLSSAADGLPAGIYSGSVWFTNGASGVTHVRSFVARIGQLEDFTEVFDANDFDLRSQTITFTPDGSTNFYFACRENATNFPTDITGANTIFLSSHSTVTLTTPTNISIYGRSTNVLYLASEGYVTLLTPDFSGNGTVTNHFTLPRMSASSVHIHPNESGGLVYWQQLSNRVAITFWRVLEFATFNTNSFQLEFFYDGRLRMTWLQYGTQTGIIGLSRGNGVPPGFAESDLSALGSCELPIAVSVPPFADEGDGVLLGAGVVKIPAPFTSNLVATLSSSAPAQASVPTNVIILAGETNATFDITVIDDAMLDGPQSVTISATAPGHRVGAASMIIRDNETATLSLLTLSAVTEGSVATATVMASTAPSATILVTLDSTDTSEIQVPASVILPAGQTSANFNITIVDDVLIDGDQQVTISASVPNWTTGMVSVVVRDNEPTNLVVVLPQFAREGIGIAAGAGLVRISGILPTNLVVSLQSSDLTELVVPATVTIFAGTIAASVDLTIVDDPDVDSSQNVIVTASAPGFIGGSTNMTITDDESPPIPVSPYPADFATNVFQTTGLYWSTTAFPSEVITNEIYFGTSPSLGLANRIGTTTNNSWLALPQLAALTTYYWQVIAKKTGVTPGPVWQFTTVGVNQFTWSSLSGTQYVSQPFPVTITAHDVYSVPVTNFTGSVRMSALNGATISPTNSGTFSNGVWSGTVAVQQPSSNVVLIASDANRSGSSTAFKVLLQNDVAISMADAPDPVSLGGNITYSIIVTNVGPLAATSVVVSNRLPATATLVSAATTQGVVLTNGGALEFALGTLPANSSASVTVVAAAISVGTLFNTATVRRAEADAYLSNNLATTASFVQSPVLSISDVNVFEGNSGTRSALFSVQVTPAPALPVSVQFSTIYTGSADASDYASTNGTLNFAAGETNKMIPVTIFGDTGYEPDETFQVILSSPVNAAFTDSLAIGTILNDDAMPLLSIEDVTVFEGNVGTMNVAFNVSLSRSNGTPVSFYYSTYSGSAFSGSDFLGTSAYVTIPAGITNTNVFVTVYSDQTIEPDEVFYVDLTSVVGANLVKREAYCLILNDDGLPGNINRFVWNPLPSTEVLGVPFNATINAQDIYDKPATNFYGTATIMALGDGGVGTNTLLGNITPVPSYYGSGTYTLAIGFTPSTDITVTHVRSVSGQKVSIWTDAGVLVAAQNVSGPNGVWTETPLGTPVTLQANVKYRVGFYTTASYYWQTNLPSTFPHGQITNGYYYASADMFPATFYTSTNPFYLCDLRYAAGVPISLPVSPSVVGPFTNGSWSGTLTALALGTNVALRADDNNGHVGISTAFNVELRNDLAVSGAGLPNPLGVGSPITYALTVTNVGPSAATGVTLTNLLGVGASLVTATSTRGSCNASAGVVFCNLGTLDANDFATVTIIARPSFTGLITNIATVYRAEPDTSVVNNSLTSVTSVEYPALSINNVAVPEGNSNSTFARFTVSLSVPVPTNVSVHVTTADGTAQAGSDYLAVSGTLVFPPDVTSQTVDVVVVGDTNSETAETFLVTLSNPTNAIIVLSNGIGTILDDEVPPFFDDFEPNIDLALWSAFGGTLGSTIIATNYGGSVSGVNSLWFGADTERFIRTQPLNTVGGGTISFYLRFGNGIAPWEQLDVPGEGVVLDYSSDGSSWFTMGIYDTSAYTNWTFVSSPIPSGAQTASTYFRWRQITHSGSCCDHWALDDVGITVGPQPPLIISHPASRAAPLGDSTAFTVVAAGSAPLLYQWRKGSVDLPNETNASYTIAAVQSNHVGGYSALVRNSYGAVTSAVATLVIGSPGLFTLSQSNITVTLNPTSAAIHSLVFQSREIYRLGSFISDWGLQRGTNPATFQRNANGSGVPQIPMALVSLDGQTATFTGYYTTGSDLVAVTREYTLLTRTDALRTRMSFRNDGNTTINLRWFDTYDVDWQGPSAVLFVTENDRYAINTNGISINVGRSAITNSPVVVALGTTNSVVIAASSSSYFGITAGDYLNWFFSSNGADMNGAPVDATLDIGKEFVLAPGAAGQVEFTHAFGTNIAAANLAVIDSLSAVSPLELAANKLGNGNLRVRLQTANRSPLSPARAAGIQFYASTNISFPMSNWTAVTNPPVLTNGMLEVNESTVTNAPLRFFRVIEWRE